MAIAHSIADFRAVVNCLAEKYKQYHEGQMIWDGEPQSDDDDNDYVPDYNLKIPPWICQPYYRLPPEEHKQMMEEKVKLAEKREKRQYFDKDGNTISRKHMKKLKRLEKRAKIRTNRHGEICETQECDNTKGLKCEFNLCRHCCRNKCFMEAINCKGHKIFRMKDHKTSTKDECIHTQEEH